MTTFSIEVISNAAIKKAKLQGFEKAIKVMYELSKDKEEILQKFIEQFAKIHEVQLKK